MAEPEDGAAEAAASELDGSGEVEDGAAEGAETLPYFSMYRAMIAFSVGRKHGYFQLLPGTSTLTALETVSGPGYCLITSMPMDWSVVFCAEEGFLGAP